MTEPKKKTSMRAMRAAAASQEAPEHVLADQAHIETARQQVGEAPDPSAPLQRAGSTGGADGQRDRFVAELGDEVVMQAARIVEDAISGIMRSAAYFTEPRLVRRALDISQKEVDRATLESAAFEELIRWSVSVRPLVTVGQTGKLTTHEMWAMENRILELGAEQNPLFVQDESAVRAAIAAKTGISEEQVAAVEAACLSPRRVSIIEGTAGAGKSFTMEAVKETYMDAGYDVIGTALSWNAARVLGSSAGIAKDKCLAIEGFTRMLLKARASGTEPFQGPTLLIVDECCMVGTRHGFVLLEETARSRYPVKIVMTGDSKQVIPVDAGNFVEMLIEFFGTTRIDTIRRQHQASHRDAVMSLSNRHSGEALNTFMHQECFRWSRNKVDLLNVVVRDYVSYRLAFPDNKALVLAYSNKDVLELNRKIRTVYKKLGLIDRADVTLKVTDGRETFESSFSVGDEVVLRANDLDLLVYRVDEKKSPLKEHTWQPIGLGINNRNAGRIVAIRRAEKPVGSYDFIIDVSGDEPCRAVINSEKFKHPEKSGLPMVHNYAGTIYGSQGQTVSHVMLVDSPQMDFRLSYVGMSRHKETVDVYLDETELHRRLDRGMGKRQSLASRLAMDAAGKSLDDAVVDVGRYTRAEMLRCVALSWCKHSANQTAVLYERRHRMGSKEIQKADEALAAIRPRDPSAPLIDFLPAYNRAFPTVDIEEILALPDLIGESELIRPSDVEQNKKGYGMIDMPVQPDATPLPTPDHRIYGARTAPARHRPIPHAQPTSGSFLGGAIGWLSSFVSPPPAEPQPTPVALRLADPVSPFAGVAGVEPEHEDPSLLEKLNAWIRPKPRADIPFRPVPPVGQVVHAPDPSDRFELAADGVSHIEKRNPRTIKTLSFEGVPAPVGVDGEPPWDWVTAQAGVLWDEGRRGEPRILARNNMGQVVARYRMNGECAVGEGFPPVIISEKASPTAPVYIVAGAKEYLWLRAEMERNHADEPHLIPHIVWAAKDVDWSMIAAPLAASQNVVIVRTAADPRQAPWAAELRDMLARRHKVRATISPELDPLPQAEVPPTPARRFDRTPQATTTSPNRTEAAAQAAAPPPVNRFRRTQ